MHAGFTAVFTVDWQTHSVLASLSRPTIVVILAPFVIIQAYILDAFLALSAVLIVSAVPIAEVVHAYAPGAVFVG